MSVVLVRVATTAFARTRMGAFRVSALPHTPGTSVRQKYNIVSLPHARTVAHVWTFAQVTSVSVRMALLGPTAKISCAIVNQTHVSMAVRVSKATVHSCVSVLTAGLGARAQKRTRATPPLVITTASVWVRPGKTLSRVRARLSLLARCATLHWTVQAVCPHRVRTELSARKTKRRSSLARVRTGGLAYNVTKPSPCCKPKPPWVPSSRKAGQFYLFINPLLLKFPCCLMCKPSVAGGQWQCLLPALFQHRTRCPCPHLHGTTML